jgi:hypothetical protein
VSVRAAARRSVERHAALGIGLLAAATLLAVVAEHRPDPQAAADPLCEAECPAGTRQSNFSATSVTRSLSDGSFVYFESGCEATCAPIVECFPPNIPVVTPEGFNCRGAPGLTDFERDDEVDLGFGALWDEAQVEVVGAGAP